MKKIICYGDSNTFGFNPVNGSRYDSNTRWTGILSKILGDEFKITEEGCNNRTCFFHNLDGVLQSGQKHLPQCLEKHKSFDIFILALGTNDLQKIFDIDECIVETGLKNSINLIRKYNPNARIILIPPVILNEEVLKGTFSYQFDEKSLGNSNLIQKKYSICAEKENCEIVDFNEYVTPSKLDGLHFDEMSHKIMAEQIANQINNLESTKEKVNNRC